MVNVEWLYTMGRPAEERTEPPVLVRRLAAVVSVLAYPVIAFALEADLTAVRDAVGAIGYAVVLAVPVLVWALAVAIVYQFRRRLAQAPDEQLDERERELRDAAYLMSYRLLGAALVLSFLACLVVVPLVAGDRTVSLDGVLAAFASLVMVAGTLPSAVVAWRDTEVDAEDDVDDALLGVR